MRLHVTPAPSHFNNQLAQWLFPVHSVGGDEESIRFCQPSLDLERFATKADLDELKRHTDMRLEDLRDDISTVAEGVGSIALMVRANQRTLESVVNRLGRHDDLLKPLVREPGI